MATGKLDVDGLRHIGRLAVFAGVRDLPTRVKCAILPWHTLHAAFNCGSKHVDRGGRRSDARIDRRRLSPDREMPKIAEIESTPNPNALKFVLREPLTWGIKAFVRQRGGGEGRPAGRGACSTIGHVTNVFYIDHWLTVTQDGGADWQELTRKIAEPLRAAPAANAQTAATVAAATSARSPTCVRKTSSAST